jgi:Ca2+-dependent lipid-binding protein
LAISDVITSGPYVEVNIHGKEIGRTNRVYHQKNKSNPEWKESITTHLLAVANLKIHFTVWDLNDLKNAEFIGDVMVDMEDIKVSIKQELGNSADPEDIVSRGSLYFSVKIEVRMKQYFFL